MCSMSGGSSSWHAFLSRSCRRCGAMRKRGGSSASRLNPRLARNSSTPAEPSRVRRNQLASANKCKRCLHRMEQSVRRRETCRRSTRWPTSLWLIFHSHSPRRFTTFAQELQARSERTCSESPAWPAMLPCMQARASCLFPAVYLPYEEGVRMCACLEKLICGSWVA